MASLAANAGRPAVIESIAEDMGVALDTLYKDARVHDLKVGQLQTNTEATREPVASESTQLILTSQESSAPAIEQEDKRNILQSNPNVPQAQSDAVADIFSRQQTEMARLSEPIIIGGLDSQEYPVEANQSTIAAQQYLKLCERYAQKDFPLAEMNPLIEQINSIADVHVIDKTFAEIVQQSGHRPAIDRFETAIYMHELAIARGEKTLETYAPPDILLTDSSSRPPNPEEATQAAKEFISLSERYAKYNSPMVEQDKMLEKMNSLEAVYLTNKDFTDTIEKSDSKITISRLETALYLREIAMNRESRMGRDM